MRSTIDWLKSQLLPMALLVSAIFIGAYFFPPLLATHKPAAQQEWIMPALPPLAVGDWVFRGGTASESYVIQQLSKSEFSHIGMIVSLDPEPLIVHATTDDDPKRPNQVLLSTLHKFTHPQLAQHFAIARPHFVNASQHKAAATWLTQQVGRPFVLTARDSAHLYCTTLLADALQHTKVDFNPQWQQINAPLLSGEYLFPKAFAEYAEVEWVYRSTK